MNVKEAIKLNQIQKGLIKKFKDAENDEIKKRNAQETEIKKRYKEEFEEETEFPIIKHFKPISVAEAQHNSKLEEHLRGEFYSQRKRDMDDFQQREKKYEPITKAIKAIEKPVSNELVPVRFAASTPRAIKFEDEEFDEESENTSTSFEESHPKINKSMKSLIDTNVINIGLIGTLNLPMANDKQFGIYYDEKAKAKIGALPIKFDFDDIIIDNTRYRGTSGLWKLLTRNEYISDQLYTKEDWENYKEILVNTNALFQKNNPETGKPKSSAGSKWKQMIKPIWDEIKNKKGSGLAKFNENPIEYKYISKINQLIQRLQYLQAQELAGNNNFHNEKLGVVKFVSEILEDLVDSPKFYKYNIRILSVLPEGKIEGSGMINDVINNLPFELHWPGFQALGPGTHLEERLARGETGINKLVSSAFEHDKWYRDHPNTEDRWEADKILQKKAWERFISNDAEIIGEKLPALVTTAAMYLKRKLGMGLNSSSYEYPY